MQTRSADGEHGGAAAASAVNVRAAFLASAGTVTGLMALALAWSKSGDRLADDLYRSQDAGWLACLIVLLIVFAQAPIPARWGLWQAASAHYGKQCVAGLAIAIGCLVWLGAHVLLRNYGLSRDEDMAEFDARIFQSGRLLAAVAEPWRDYFEDSGAIFRLPIPDNVAWASAYLPVNAAFRAFFGLLGDRALTGPFFAMVSLIAVFAVACKLWPERRDAAFVALVFLALSPQFLVTAMTAYAMSGHLALNALWLLLFLRDDRRGHAGAAGVGFLATGLHQIAFHPLFVAPFIVQLWFQGKRSVATCYVVAYAAIGLFWAQYFGLVMSLEGFGPQAAGDAGVRLFIERVFGVLEQVDFDGARTMVKNVLRFIGWQHVLLLPFAWIGMRSLRGANPVLHSLVAGLVLNGLVVFALMPHQGFGWGYRYWHGLLIGASLVAAWGWIVVHQRFGEVAAVRMRSIFMVGTIVSLFGLLPVRLWQAHALTQPYALAYEAIQRAPVDVVLVDRERHRFLGDLVRNDPYLRNVPLILEMTSLTPTQIGDLCGRYRVGVFGAEQATALGVHAFDAHPEAARRLANARRELAAIKCGSPVETDLGK